MTYFESTATLTKDVYKELKPHFATPKARKDDEVAIILAIGGIIFSVFIWQSVVFSILLVVVVFVFIVLSRLGQKRLFLSTLNIYKRA